MSVKLLFDFNRPLEVEPTFRKTLADVSVLSLDSKELNLKSNKILEHLLFAISI